jgi:hypothetical protein
VHSSSPSGSLGSFAFLGAETLLEEEKKEEVQGELLEDSE